SPPPRRLRVAIGSTEARRSSSPAAATSASIEPFSGRSTIMSGRCRGSLSPPVAAAIARHRPTSRSSAELTPVLSTSKVSTTKPTEPNKGNENDRHDQTDQGLQLLGRRPRHH